MTGILAGLRVIEGSAFVAAPLGGMTLAQMGAEQKIHRHRSRLARGPRARRHADHRTRRG
jgi:crotonobetainyl-CoA:carnitine CoA-transferase CaiB-like acyl-CoA transferase